MTAAAAHTPSPESVAKWHDRLRQITVPSRGDRYRARAGATGIAIPAPISFAELAAIPAWLNWPDQQQQSLAMMTAILSNVDSIERELSGEKLRALAVAIGSDLFGHVAEQYFEVALKLTQIQDTAPKLPRPEDLEQLGRHILVCSLPCALQARFPEAANDPHSQAIVALACDAVTSFRSLAETPADDGPQA